jgi:hypothetical protein
MNQELSKLITKIREEKLSMVPELNFYTVLRHLDSINSVEGDIVECGVWKGGFSIFLASAFTTKKIWVADSFEGFQPVEIAKYQYSSERHVPSFNLGRPGTENDFTLEVVQERFKNYGLADPRIRYLKGYVKDTLPASGIEKIALLRVDVDAYSASKEVLDELYDKVQPNGYIIFDDICLRECRDAMRDFFSERSIPGIVFHPETDEILDLNSSYTSDDSGFPQGCYIIKK